MFLWTCTKCQNSNGNTNTTKNCKVCGKRISCQEAGGHYGKRTGSALVCTGVENNGETPCTHFEKRP